MTQGDLTAEGAAPDHISGVFLYWGGPLVRDGLREWGERLAFLRRLLEARKGGLTAKQRRFVLIRHAAISGNGDAHQRRCGPPVLAGNRT